MWATGEGIISFYSRRNVHLSLPVSTEPLKAKENAMPRMIIDEDIRPMSEVRAGIASFLKQIHDTKRPLVITQHGKGVAVMLDVGEYERMQEKLELLQDIQTSITQLDRGEGVPHKEAKNDVLKELRK